MNSVSLTSIIPNRSKALMLARRELSTFVWDAVNLEGINFTLPEVQTLLDGITIGGRRLSDQQITLNQAEAWKLLFQWVGEGRFALTVEKVLALHAVAGYKEALEWGAFRAGGVTIAGTDYMPPSADQLPALFRTMVEDAEKLADIYDQAIHVFLIMARCQFFYDVNKRMGRFMMNGVLLDAGYPAINVPARRQLEFNELMLRFYESGDQRPMNQFMRSCLDPRIVQIMSEG
jgi:Fic family protein